MYENLCKKYDLTVAQIQAGVEIVSNNLGKICNSLVAVAVCELLCCGDIKEKEPAPSANGTSSEQ